MIGSEAGQSRDAVIVRFDHSAVAACAYCKCHHNFITHTDCAKRSRNFGSSIYKYRTFTSLKVHMPQTETFIKLCRKCMVNGYYHMETYSLHER